MTDVKTPEDITTSEEAARIITERRQDVADLNRASDRLDPTPEPQTPEIPEETLNQLRALGFDHIPTVEEVRERLNARRAQIREEVLFQADRRGWCEDGTRQVCANLRLTRPGERERRTLTTKVTLELEYTGLTWTERGLLTLAMTNNALPVDVSGRLFGSKVVASEVHEVKIGDQVIELTDELVKEIKP